MKTNPIKALSAFLIAAVLLNGGLIAAPDSLTPPLTPQAVHSSASMSLEIFTLVHVLISLAAIAAGFVVAGALLGGKHPAGWTKWFLATTAATSVTGFFFPFHGFTPAYALAVLSLLVLAAASYALYSRRLAGGWRQTYVISVTTALYLNFFVLIVQLFLRSPALHQLAPTGGGPVFGLTQGLVLIGFIALGRAALRRFPGEAPSYRSATAAKQSTPQGYPVEKLKAQSAK